TGRESRGQGKGRRPLRLATGGEFDSTDFPRQVRVFFATAFTPSEPVALPRIQRPVCIFTRGDCSLYFFRHVQVLIYYPRAPSHLARHSPPLSSASSLACGGPHPDPGHPPSGTGEASTRRVRL
ncbi:unnamed protein product, partial [Ectocarpus sp. 4 AP-2014]